MSRLRKITTLIALASVAGVGTALVLRRRRRWQEQHDATGNPGAGRGAGIGATGGDFPFSEEEDELAIRAATSHGVMPVDPESRLNFAGEGIDPDLDLAPPDDLTDIVGGAPRNRSQLP